MNEPGSVEPTEVLPPTGGRGARHEPTQMMPRHADAGPDPRERTQVLGQPEAAGARPATTSYTEEYAADERTVVDQGEAAAVADHSWSEPPAGSDPGKRTWTTTTMVLTAIAALLIGAILTLLLLPEEDRQVVLSEQEAQQALLEAQQLSAEQQARIAELEAALAQRDAELAEAQAQVAGDQAALDQAQSEREAALAEREAALGELQATLDGREQAVAAREEAVTAAEAAAAAAAQQAAEAAQQAEQAAEDAGLDLPDIQLPELGGDGPVFEIPDVGEVDIPELPSVDEDVARGIFERFIDRLGSFFE